MAEPAPKEPKVDSILYWNDIAMEAHRRDYTFDDIQGDDELGTPMDRQTLQPRIGGPTRVSRAFAIIHLAMYDALLLADEKRFADQQPVFKKLKPYQMGLSKPASPLSREAAVAGAAATTIQALFGGTLCAPALNQFRVHLHQAGQSASAIEDALEYGAFVGRSLLDSRANDGAEFPDAMYRPFPLVGLYRPDPFSPAPPPSVGPTWGALPFFGKFGLGDLKFVGPTEALGGVSNAPKDEAFGEFLKTPGWKDDLALVRKRGGAPELKSTERTPEETLIGIFWGYDGIRHLGVPPRLYNQCLVAISQQAGDPPAGQKKGLTVEENAVLFALANMAMADAGIAAWHEKYVYHVGRPVTVIRESDAGFGPDAAKRESSTVTFDSKDLPLPIGTSYPDVAKWLAKVPKRATLVDGDTAWAPLGAPQTNTHSSTGGRGLFNRSPNFPAYPSGHATFGSSCFGAAHRLLSLLASGTKRNARKLDPDMQFTFVSDEYDGLNFDADGSSRPRHRRRLTLSQAIHENAWSRVYLGVHWRMDAIEGVRLGEEILKATSMKAAGPASVF